MRKQAPLIEAQGFRIPKIILLKDDDCARLPFIDGRSFLWKNCGCVWQQKRVYLWYKTQNKPGVQAKRIKGGHQFE